jgi:hypothetical protein
MRPLPVRPIAGAALAGSSLLVVGQQPAQVRVFNVKDGTPALGEPILPGAPPPPPIAISSTYRPGEDIPIVRLDETELSAAMPTAIRPEVEGESAGLGSGAKPSPISGDMEIAAPPHLLEDPVTHLPMVLVLTRDIARGAGATLVTREFDPPLAPLSPLPNMVMIAPQGTQTAPIR